MCTNYIVIRIIHLRYIKYDVTTHHPTYEYMIDPDTNVTNVGKESEEKNPEEKFVVYLFFSCVK